MEILVLALLALFLIIIAILVVIYVIVRKNHVNKKFDKQIENDLFDSLDDDDDDLKISNLNIVMPIDSNKESFNNAFKDEKITIVEPVQFKENTANLENEKVEPVQVEENASKLEEEKIAVIEPVQIKEENMPILEEVVNVLINKRNYIFLANNNVVNKNDYITINLDGKTYFGVVTKANYEKDISKLKVKPRKLNIIKTKSKENKEEHIVNVSKETNVEYMPIKKNQS